MSINLFGAFRGSLMKGFVKSPLGARNGCHIDSSLADSFDCSCVLTFNASTGTWAFDGTSTNAYLWGLGSFLTANNSKRAGMHFKSGLNMSVVGGSGAYYNNFDGNTSKMNAGVWNFLLEVTGTYFSRSDTSYGFIWNYQVGSFLPEVYFNEFKGSDIPDFYFAIDELNTSWTGSFQTTTCAPFVAGMLLEAPLIADSALTYRMRGYRLGTAANF